MMLKSISQKIQISKDTKLDQRVYNSPTAEQVAAIWVEGNNANLPFQHDIVIHAHSGDRHRIKHFYGCYDPLQYPLLFPRGETGWHQNINKLPTTNSHIKRRGRHSNVHSELIPSTISSATDVLSREQQVVSSQSNRKVSCREYNCYRIQIRSPRESVILFSGRLFQQYLVDMYIKLETTRLDYYRHNQSDMRCELYQGIKESVQSGECRGSEVGKRIVLPSSFIGGPRDMRRRYLDALALVQKFGKPDLFITMTCNPEWQEIKDKLFEGQLPQDRPDLVSRVFRAKLQDLKGQLFKKQIFGEVVAHVHVIEFQKRGLPHAHMLIILKSTYKIATPDHFDKFVCAELPSETEDPELFALVVKHMMHGPCGDINKNNSCMIDGKCKYHYPRKFCDTTTQGKDGYPVYRRRQNGLKVKVRNAELDNQWVVPYSPYLLSRYNCHINVEICSGITVVKYLYKYIYKGHDRVAVGISHDNNDKSVDEIKQFQDARWVSAQEAAWRIFEFNLNEICPAVINLPLHLPNQHCISYWKYQNLEKILSFDNSSKTMLTEFFSFCSENEEARQYLYRDFPQHYVWDKYQKFWKKRIKQNVIGRINSANPIEGESFSYLKQITGSMAAYGALLSLTNTIDQIQNHPRPPISLDKLKIKPLIQMVAFLMQFLENYIIDDEDGLEGRMVDAAQEAEDIIESHIADHIEAHGEANTSSMEDDSLYRELQKVIHDLNSITKDVVVVKEKAGKKITPSCTKDDVMLGSDDVMNNIMDKLNNSPSKGDNTMASVMNDIMDKLTNQQSNHRIIAIAGMGGIGKTTLAKKIYEIPLIAEYFDMHGWATVSQEFDSKRILLEVLCCLKLIRSEDKFSQMSKHELGDTLYKSLFGRRYMIVMDDIWGMDAWDGVKQFFPNNDDGSRVLITTRLSKVALQLDGPDYFQMSLLNQNESWNLLHGCVFGEQGCPLELEQIGKDIAGKCRGLPLSIVVIGGLLAKSEQTQENWQHIVENLSSTVNLEEDERCFRILKLSYNQLPVHLKPCFLYMGMFPEDHEISVPMLLKLWVAEGFVKAVAGKSLETVARIVYLHDLVIRNLIMVRGWGCTQRIKQCGMHDLLRDLCIKEAEKYKFFRTMETTHNNPEHHDQISWRAQRRIGIHEAGNWKYIPRPLPKGVQSASHARTLIWEVNEHLASVVPFRLLRVLNEKGYRWSERFVRNNFHLVNLRHLYTQADLSALEFPPEFSQLWNLQNWMGNKGPVMLDIWRMTQLRHVKVSRLQLTDPPPMDGEKVSMVLENLETLMMVYHLRLGDEVVERIPNIKKLALWYEEEDEEEEELSPGDYRLDNLCQLHKLEALAIISRPTELARDLMITFPASLRKLKLFGLRLGWEEMGTKIGSLPYLEALKLYDNAFVGLEWETADGGFRSLKYLKIYVCSGLEQWRAEAAHFPRLERLDLEKLDKLKEIPLEIADITTLREIRVVRCNDSTVLSAKKILEEQQNCLGKVELQITVWIHAGKSQLRGSYHLIALMGGQFLETYFLLKSCPQDRVFVEVLEMSSASTTYPQIFAECDVLIVRSGVFEAAKGGLKVVGRAMARNVVQADASMKAGMM
ncbi:DNA helicase homolog [Striga asiatica]|uniref:DNA helicase homolog n=1 Tax=Striga asiatica TaxID=4170 RepID=A0A5A7Q220_STRAF|nr:DNA helicase homolog [Striga asiatica]